MTNKDFLERYIDQNGTISTDILKIDEDLTNICWLPITDTFIEPDNWNDFWNLWNNQKTVTNPEGFVDIEWESLCIWKSPLLTNEQIQKIYPQKIVDWSAYFPKMIEKLKTVMPFKEVWKITLASNTKRIPLHVDITFDRKYEILLPWPNSVRTILYDTNEKPTFYLSRWSEECLKRGKIKDPKNLNEWGHLDEPLFNEKCYVQLPKKTNTFVYSNGEFMHGADFAGKSKILVLVWGRPDEDLWKKKLKHIRNQLTNYEEICMFKQYEK